MQFQLNNLFWSRLWINVYANAFKFWEFEFWKVRFQTLDIEITTNHRLLCLLLFFVKTLSILNFIEYFLLLLLLFFYSSFIKFYIKFFIFNDIFFSSYCGYSYSYSDWLRDLLATSNAGHSQSNNLRRIRWIAMLLRIGWWSAVLS